MWAVAEKGVWVFACVSEHDTCCHPRWRPVTWPGVSNGCAWQREKQARTYSSLTCEAQEGPGWLHCRCWDTGVTSCRWVWLVTKRLWRPVKLTKVGASKGFTHFLCHHRSHEFLKKWSFHDRHVTDSMMEGKEEEALWRIKLRSNTPSHCIITCDKRGVILYNFMPCVFSCFCIHHARLCGNISTLLFEMTGLHGHKVLPRGPPWVKPLSESVATNYMVSHYTGVNKAQTLPFGTAMSVVLATVVWLIRNIETTNSFL